MTEPRLKTSLWVSSVLRSAAIDCINGTVIYKGDPDAGSVIVVLRGQDGFSLLSQTRTSDGEPAWIQPIGKPPLIEQAVDNYIGKQIRVDPDIWVIEFEVRDLIPPFQARLLTA